MVYTKPTRAERKTTRKKHLTIGNTDKYNNYSSITEAEISKMKYITKDHVKIIKNNIAKKLNKGRIDNKSYMYERKMSLTPNLPDPNTSDLVDIIGMGVDFTYHAIACEVPDEILQAMAKSVGKTRVLYTYSSDYYHSVEDVAKAHEATRVVFELPIIVPDVSATDIITAFDPYKTNIDEVQIDVSPLTTEEIEYGLDTKNEVIVNLRKSFYFMDIEGIWYPSADSKYRVYKGLEKAFSSWGTYITMICRDDKDKAQLDKLVSENK